MRTAIPPISPITRLPVQIADCTFAPRRAVRSDFFLLPLIGTILYPRRVKAPALYRGQLQAVR